MTDSTTFRELCETIQTIRETRGSNAKISTCANYISQLSDDNLYLACRFIGEGAFDNISGKRASVGSRTSGLAAAHFCGIDYDLVFKPCRTATGSSSETIEKLMFATPAAREKRNPKKWTLTEVEYVFERLFDVSSRADKQDLLLDTWQQMTPVEIKYFIRMLGQGSLRIGFETRSLVSAIAKAFDHDTETVRYAHMITGSTGKTAVLAKHDRLDEATFKLFHPLSFMLASPIESRALDSLDGYICEEKFDGMRCQLHADGNSIKLFSRDLNDITKTFPDIISTYTEKELPPTVLDGEICVFRDNTIQPFQLLQKRMGVKKPGKKILEQYPVIFIAYDLLFNGSQPIFDETLNERRKQLRDIAREYDIPITLQFQVDDRDHLETLFEKALANGNEGLMLKKDREHIRVWSKEKILAKGKKTGRYVRYSDDVCPCRKRKARRYLFRFHSWYFCKRR